MQVCERHETRFSLSPATGDKRTFTYFDLYRGRGYRHPGYRKKMMRTKKKKNTIAFRSYV